MFERKLAAKAPENPIDSFGMSRRELGEHVCVPSSIIDGIAQGRYPEAPPTFLGGLKWRKLDPQNNFPEKYEAWRVYHRAQIIEAQLGKPDPKITNPIDRLCVSRSQLAGVLRVGYGLIEAHCNGRPPRLQPALAQALRDYGFSAERVDAIRQEYDEWLAARAKVLRASVNLGETAAAGQADDGNGE